LLLQYATKITRVAHVKSFKGTSTVSHGILSALAPCSWVLAHFIDQIDVLQGVDTAGLKFRLVDAKEQVVGRLAAQLSVILQVRDRHHLPCIKQHTLCMFCRLIAWLQLAFCCGA